MFERMMKLDYVPFPCAGSDGSLQGPQPARIFEVLLHVQINPLESPKSGFPEPL